jgi:PAS domain S-box-containing protein
MKDQEHHSHYLGPSEQKRRQRVASLIVGGGIAACGIGMLIGWVFDIPILQTSLVNGRIANPWEVLSVLVLGIGYILYGLTTSHRMIQTASILTALIALLALVLPPWFDAILFGEKVSRIGQTAYFSYFSAIGLLLVAVLQLAIYRRLVKVVTTALILLSSVVLVNLYSKFYIASFVRDQIPELLMTLAMSAVFILVIGHAFYMLRLYAARMALKSLTRIGIVIALIVVAVQIAGYLSWSLSVAYNKEDSREEFSRAVNDVVTPAQNVITARKSALEGYQNYFSNKSAITQQDFDGYYDTIRQTSLGVAGIDYVEPGRSAAKDKAIIFSSQDSSLSLAQRVRIASVGESVQKQYTKVLFIEDRTESQGGYFAFVIPLRHQGAQKSAAIVAYVPATVIVKDFSDNYSIDAQVLVRISTPDRKQVIYESGADALRGRERLTDIVDISDDQSVLLSIAVAASSTVGLTKLQLYLPFVITVLTQFISVLMIAILLLYARTKARTEDIIAVATNELEQERNYALQLHRKDEAIIAGIADGLAVIDKRGRVQLINAAGKNMLGIKEDQPLGLAFDKLLVAYTSEGKEIDIAHRPISIALNTGKTVSKTIYYAHSSGKSFPAQVRVSPIKQNEEIIGAIELFRDVTKDFELDKAKSEFVALASHQLRTPLSAVNWYGEMLLAGDAGKLNKVQQEYIQEIYDGNKRMISLISDLLDVSRMELGRLINNPSHVHLQEVVSSVATELENDVQLKRIKLKLEVDKKLPGIYGDEKMLRIIIQNLMSNAVKYTPQQGSVHITLRRATKDDFTVFSKKPLPHFVHFSVKDTGYGIPRAQQEKIFQKLFRADNVRRLDVEGTGLGLYMVKEVAEKLGGAVTFESIESIGTTFSVILPLQTTRSKQKK